MSFEGHACVIKASIQSKCARCQVSNIDRLVWNTRLDTNTPGQWKVHAAPIRGAPLQAVCSSRDNISTFPCTEHSIKCANCDFVLVSKVDARIEWGSRDGQADAIEALLHLVVGDRVASAPLTFVRTS
jgi:hypothetical protein